MKTSHMIVACLLVTLGVSTAMAQLRTTPPAAPPKVAPAVVNSNLELAAINAEIAALKKDLAAEKAKTAALESEVALVKNQVGLAVGVNVKQGQMLQGLPERVETLETRFNNHRHYAMYADIIDGKHKLPWNNTTPPTEFCKGVPGQSSGSATWACDVPK